MKEAKVYLIKQTAANGVSYKVSRTINILVPSVGDTLNQDEAQDLIHHPRITVIVDERKPEQGRVPYRPIIAHKGDY